MLKTQNIKKLIDVDIWQNQYNIVKLKNKIKIIKKENKKKFKKTYFMFMGYIIKMGSPQLSVMLCSL